MVAMAHWTCGGGISAGLGAELLVIHVLRRSWRTVEVHQGQCTRGARGCHAAKQDLLSVEHGDSAQELERRAASAAAKGRVRVS